MVHGKDEYVQLIELPRIETHGHLTVVEAEKQIPFKIERIYYIYDVPHGQVRGGHAHRDLQELIIAINGSFDAIVEDRAGRKRYHLDQPHIGLYLPRMVWREIEEITPGAVCLVVSSKLYDERDYIRDYEGFKRLLKDEIVTELNEL